MPSLCFSLIHTYSLLVCLAAWKFSDGSYCVCQPVSRSRTLNAGRSVSAVSRTHHSGSPLDVVQLLSKRNHKQEMQIVNSAVLFLSCQSCLFGGMWVEGLILFLSCNCFTSFLNLPTCFHFYHYSIRLSFSSFLYQIRLDLGWGKTLIIYFDHI